MEGRVTAVTADGKWTAQCEHTLLITEDGVDILTASPKGLWGQLHAEGGGRVRRARRETRTPMKDQKTMMRACTRARSHYRTRPSPMPLSYSIRDGSRAVPVVARGGEMWIRARV